MEPYLETKQEQKQLNVQQVSLPNSTTVLVLGIISIIGCFLAGIGGIIVGVISLMLAKKDKNLYNLNPSLYIQSSYYNLKAGRVCAIVGLILSSLYLIYFITLLAIAIQGVSDVLHRPWH